MFRYARHAMYSHQLAYFVERKISQVRLAKSRAVQRIGSTDPLDEPESLGTLPDLDIPYFTVHNDAEIYSFAEALQQLVHERPRNSDEIRVTHFGAGEI